jgi:glycosyltransferase involved in cell wall biosynthesis
MRVAYLHYLCHGATGLHHVDQFTRAARRLGHDIVVHSMNLAPGEPSDAESSGRTLRLRRAAKIRFGRYLHEPKELLWNLRYIKRETGLVRSIRPDVLLVRDHLLTASSVVVARRLDLPLVIELNAPVAESRLYFDQYVHLPLIPERLEAWKLRRADAVTVVSTALKRHVVARYGLPESKLTVVPNGADPDVFRPDSPCDPEIRRRFGGRVVVGFVGSFQKFHGQELLSRMVERVGSARPEVGFVFAGRGPGADEVKRAVTPLGDRALFLGSVARDRVPAVVASFDIGVMSDSNFYGSPLKVLEWMSAGRAVVAPRYGPLEEIIRDGVEGLLFEPGDVDALADTLIRLIDDPQDAERMGQAAARRVRSSLTWTHNAERVLSACERSRETHRCRPPS